MTRSTASFAGETPRPADRRSGGAARSPRFSLRAVLTVAILAVVAGHYFRLAVTSGLDIDTAGSLYWLDLFAERSTGTWLNAVILGAIAFPALACGAASEAPRMRRGWFAVAGLALLLSIDEVAGLHESAIGAMRAAADLPGALYYAAWTIPALAALAAFLAWQWRFFRMLPRPLAVRVAAGTALYVAAAAGFEVLQSTLLSAAGDEERWTPVLQVTVGIEEGLEMAGGAVVLLALVRHLAVVAPRWVVEAREEPTGVAAYGAAEGAAGPGD